LSLWKLSVGLQPLVGRFRDDARDFAGLEAEVARALLGRAGVAAGDFGFGFGLILALGAA
jgi:hypothetical protein